MKNNRSFKLVQFRFLCWMCFSGLFFMQIQYQYLRHLFLRNPSHEKKKVLSPLGSPTKFQDILTKVNCDDKNVFKNLKLNSKIRLFLSEEAIMERTKDCDAYFNLLRPIGRNLSDEENYFPIAFSHSGNIIWTLSSLAAYFSF